jgi:hypothetical protein
MMAAGESAGNLMPGSALLAKKSKVRFRGA